MTRTNKIRFALSLTDVTYYKLKEMAKDSGMSMSSLGNQIISNHLKAYEILYQKMTDTKGIENLAKMIDDNNIQIDYEYHIQEDKGKGYNTVMKVKTEEMAMKVFDQYTKDNPNSKNIRIKQFAELK